MYISKFRIKNYKSFNDSDEIELNEGINIITGQNNAGKTSLIKTLAFKFSNDPHKSSFTKKTSDVVLKKESELEITLVVPKDELENFLFNNPNVQLIMPRGISNLLVPAYLKQFLNQDLAIKFKVQNGNKLVSMYWPQYQDDENDNVYIVYNVSSDRTVYGNYAPHSLNSRDNNFYKHIFSQIVSRSYLFHAERFHVSSYKFGNGTDLLSDASNLPQVLMNLQSNNRIRFRRYNEAIRKIFPQIYEVSVRAKKNGNFDEVEIVVWNEDPNMEREDLVVPLSESGTGLSQVLAILYVVMTSEISKVIIIDEPNSFLHPGAARKLIEFLKGYPHHQFILATHSPSTISAANPQTINIIKNRNAQSYIEPVSVRDVKNLQLYLAEIGAKLSDVYGADNILWVEGKTEEICFPKIIDKMKDVSLMGTAVLAVKSTGDFESKHTQAVFDIYKKLSSGKGLLPPAIAFIFDRENKKQSEIDDLKRQSGDIVYFSIRKMYENYLINPKAIESVLSKIEGIRDLHIDVMKINDWLNENKWNREFINQRYATQKNEEEWLKNHDGAKLLTKMFSDLTEKRVAFDKITHSVALTEWIIENDFEALNEYKELLKEILK